MKPRSATEAGVRLAALLLGAILLAPGQAGARIVEEQADVPVKVADAYGKVVERSIRITIFRGGGNPDTRPANPCSPARLRRLFSDWGRSARVPILWVYSENDRYFGVELPRAWFEVFRSQGGIGELQAMPAVGADGHNLFGSFPAEWQPAVAAFPVRQGFDIKPSEVKAP